MVDRTRNERRVVITGLGLLTPLGSTPATFWDSLGEGRSGIRTITHFNPSGLPVRIAGEVPDFDAKKYIVDRNQRRSLRMMSRTIELAVCAAHLAIEDGRVQTPSLDPTRFGVEFGSSQISSELSDFAEASRLCADDKTRLVDMVKWGQQGIKAIHPLFMLKYLPNMLACHVSMIHNAQGPNNSITVCDLASLLALGEAYRILTRDQADFFLVGGADSKIKPLAMTRHCLFEKLSHNNAAPEKASRPFDRRRDGMVLGEGATVMTVEDLDHARKRGARIYAELVGFGAAFDSKLDGRGLARAIQVAMQEAGIGPDDVDHLNAHGLSTIQDDCWEAQGINEAFQGRSEPIAVLAPKSYFGNLSAGAGLTELAASILALNKGQVPATLNYDEPDPRCPVSVIAGQPRPVKREYVVKTGFTRMGQCAAVVLRQWKE